MGNLLNEYEIYKKRFIKHHNECRMCRTDWIESNLYIWYRECRACLNSVWEWYFWKPRAPLTYKEWIYGNKTS